MARKYYKRKENILLNFMRSSMPNRTNKNKNPNPRNRLWTCMESECKSSIQGRLISTKPQISEGIFLTQTLNITIIDDFI